ncbi:Endo-1,4-beta-xylanase A precursor [Eubacteriaceae bacterium CHKCI005]|nr:Endo-1,4-beta-xylanase A precursor [Eubacteriaceae bacterium CHKCI005]
MKKPQKILAFILSASLTAGCALPGAALAQSPGGSDATDPAPYAGEDRLYAIATSHLDTVWSWPLEETIREYLPSTLRDNFQLFEEFPDYKFTWEGAYRYQLIEEYYPEEFETLKKYMDSGNWNFGGSGLENGDVNVPSPEALFRNFLYGNNYIEEKFGADKRSRDVYLPDCFGFGYALPSIAAHSNLLGFSTQKLSWGHSFENGLPFDIGNWYGPDGESIVANINLNGYVSEVGTVRGDSGLLSKLNQNKAYGYSAASRLFGVGDMGGASGWTTVSNVLGEQALNDSEKVKVIGATTDQLFREMTEEERSGLPSYDGEMVMREHGVGGYTSRAISKRWNRQSELMGDNAERSLVASTWLGATEYPQEKLTEAWTRVIAHQFHDDIPGTSTGTVYNRSWNDYMLSIKQFAAEYENGVDGVASEMDTSVESGVPLVVNNPVAADRNDLVEATVTMPEDCASVRVYDADGNEVASQVLVKDGNQFDIVFMASVGSMGYRTYNVRPAATACDMESNLSVSENKLSNEKYDVTIDENGDISSIFDKELDKELLAEPIRLALFDDTEWEWPAWELKYEDYAKKMPKDTVKDEAMDISVVEDGPARVAIRVVRQHGSSTYDQVISLTSGGQIVAVDNVVDWDERATLLKAEFNLTSSNPTATYDLGLGAIERGNNTDRKAEVPLQKWADLSATDDSYGVSILNDCKYGMDKYDDDTLRLTLIHTPQYDMFHTGVRNYSGQHVQEVGENRFGFAIYGHEGNFGSGTQIEAEAFNQPMKAFQTVSHQGSLGDDYSFGSISNENVLVRAVKKAEKSDEIVIRVNEGTGEAASNVEVYLGEGIESAREIYASEEEIGPATVKDGKLVFDIGAYGVKSFAVTLKEPTEKADARQMTPVDLPYNIDAYSSNDNKMDGSINALNETYPSELVPDSVLSSGITYQMGSKEDGQNNAVAAKGQTITLPEGYNTLHLLAASTQGDKDVTFRVGDKDVTLNIGDYKENVGCWDQYDLGIKGYVKDQDPALIATHRHTAGVDNIAATTYMFAYDLDISGASTITLPDDDSIIIFAATAENDAAKTEAVSELYDHRERTNEAHGFAGTSGFEPVVDEMPSESWSENNKNIDDLSCIVTDEDAASGVQSLKVSGTDSKDSDSFVYYNVYKAAHMKVVPGTILTYQFKPLNELGRYVSMDLQFNEGSPLRDIEGAVDQDGVQMHPSKGRGTVGEWTTVTCDLYAAAGGKTITNVMAAYDHGPDTGEFSALIDHVFIGIPADRASLMSAMEEVQALDISVYSDDDMKELARLTSLAQDLLDDPEAYEGDISYVSQNLHSLLDTLVARDAFSNIEAEGFDSAFKSGDGVKNEGSNIGYLNDGDWVIYRNVDFGSNGAEAIELFYSGEVRDTTGTIQVRLDSASGPLLGTISTPGTAGWSNYTLTTAALDEKVTGVHDVCLLFDCSRNVDYFRFIEKVDKAPLTSLILQAEAVDRSNKTPASLQILDEATAEAQAIVENPNATAKEILDSVEKMRKALASLETIKPAFERMEAEHFDDATTEGDGVKDEGNNLGYTNNGDWVMYKNIDFADDCAVQVEMFYSGEGTGEDSCVEVRADAVDGTLLATVATPPTGTWSDYRTATADLEHIPEGVKNIYFVFRGSKNNICNIDYFLFHQGEANDVLKKTVQRAENQDLNGKTPDSIEQLAQALAYAKQILDDEQSTSQDRIAANNRLNQAILSLEVIRDPFDRIEAEGYDDATTQGNGVVIQGDYIGYINDNDWVMYQNVDFRGKQAVRLEMRYAGEGTADDSRVEVRLDSVDGPLLTTISTPPTGTWSDWETLSVDLPASDIPDGMRDVYLVFHGSKESICNVDYFLFHGNDLKADLESVLNEASSYDAADYTEESYDSLNQAMESAKAIQENPDASNEQYIEAITDVQEAIDSLVVKNYVLSASADKDVYEPNETITLTIQTTADRSRIALFNENGRYVSILGMKSTYHPADNTKTWTVKTSVASLGENRQLTIATAGSSGKIVQSDTKVQFSIQAKPSGAKLISVSGAGTAKVNEPFTIEVETTANVEQIGIYNERGNGITKQSVETCVNGDVKTFTITLSVGSTGNRIFTIKAKDPATGRYLDDMVLTLPITITK